MLHLAQLQASELVEERYTSLLVVVTLGAPTIDLPQVVGNSGAATCDSEALLAVSDAVTLCCCWCVGWILYLPSLVTLGDPIVDLLLLSMLPM